MKAREFGASFQRLVDDVLARLRHTSDIAAAFALAEWLATVLWKNHSSIYRLDELESILLDKVPEPPMTSTDHGREDGVETHLATEVYRSGGHSPLMAHLIRHADRPVRVLLTRMHKLDAAANVLGVSIDQVRSAGGIQHPVPKVHMLVQHMIRTNRVIASLHPNDVLGAVAIRMAKRLRSDLQMGFVNHADHVYSVGIGAADHVLEISAYGWNLRKSRMTEERSSFIGIPIQLKETDHRETRQTDHPTFLTGGAPYKFRPLPGMSLPPVLGRLLKRHPTATLTILGPKKQDWWWWPLRLQGGKRVMLSQAIPKENYQGLLSACTIYIDSHPVLGGTALPEALMAGCNVAGIRGVVWGYSCADELLSPDPEAFLHDCEKLLQQDAPALLRQQDTRAQCRALHDPAYVRSRLNDALTGKRVKPPFAHQDTQDFERPLELFWQRSGRLVHPGKNECQLLPEEKKWLAHCHLQHFGISSWSTLKILFYAHTRT